MTETAEDLLNRAEAACTFPNGSRKSSEEPMTEHKLRCGDLVRVQSKPDETLVVAYADYERDRAAFFGWPFGTCRISEVELVDACSDGEHGIAVAVVLDRDGFDGRDEGCDDRRQTAHMLYRPRSYWAGIVKRSEEELRAASEALAHARQRLLEAQQGPEDA